MNLKNIYTSKLRYMGPTLTYSDDEAIPCQHTINTGDLVDAEININIATIYGRYDKNGLWSLKKPIDVAAKYLEPVKPDTIHFDPKDDVDRNEPWYRSEIKRICKEHNWTLEIRSKDFLDIQVLEQTNEPNTYRQVAREHTEYIKEKDVEVYKRLYERLVIISNKPKDDVRPDNFFDKLFEQIGKINTKHGFRPCFDCADEWKRMLDKQWAEKYGDTHFTPKKVMDAINDDFDVILSEMSDTHKAKNHDYGNSFEELYKECGSTYAYAHLKEKLNRIKTLRKSRQQVKKESMEDSLLDLASYAIMWVCMLRKEKKDEA